MDGQAVAHNVPERALVAGRVHAQNYMKSKQFAVCRLSVPCEKRPTLL
jgi:hypothetical protein